MGGDRRGNHGRYRRVVGHIGDDRLRRPAGGVDLRHRLRRPRAGQVGDDDPRPLPRHGDAGRPADAGAAAGDQRGFAFEQPGHGAAPPAVRQASRSAAAMKARVPSVAPMTLPMVRMPWVWSLRCSAATRTPSRSSRQA